MPAYADGLCWLVSKDAAGRRFLSVFNNEGNERSLTSGNTIRHEADARVKIVLKEGGQLRKRIEGVDPVVLEQASENVWYASVPAAGFAVLEF